MPTHYKYKFRNERSISNILQFIWIFNPIKTIYDKVTILFLICSKEPICIKCKTPFLWGKIGKFVHMSLLWILPRILKPLSCWTRIYTAFANSVDPDRLASEEANWSGSALFAIKYVNSYQQSGSINLIGWKFGKGVASIYSAGQGLNSEQQLNEPTPVKIWYSL